MEHLELIGHSIKTNFQTNRRVLSFAEYLSVVEENPWRHTRNAAQYITDVFNYFGTEVLKLPTGEVRRFKLFDAPWDNGESRLIGEEEVQNAIFRILQNFVRQQHVDRFTLLHGPNGSSKSTIIELMARALEYYSSLPEGAIYCFNWIFPSKKVDRSGIGFAEAEDGIDARQTFAYLEDESIDARLICELHDHPLLLFPQEERLKVIDKMYENHPDRERQKEFLLSEYISKGALCHKCKLVYESLLNSYQGDYFRVLRHVQVERFYISRRYRRAVSRVEPLLAVDAKERQVTMDRSLSSLPTALQSINLFELTGDLVQANRGLIDYADLLKRPVEAFKYLITTVEDGRVTLDQINLFFDMIFIGSTNEMHLNAFMESPEWMSFKARMELVAVPYLLDYTKERAIYQEQITTNRVGKHIAPHAASIIALWAVLTRMHKPNPERYEKGLRELVVKLSPLDKAELYATGKLPKDVKGDDAKILSAGIQQIYKESINHLLFEGRIGASPREVKTTYLNAAQNPRFECLTPIAVMEELRSLVKETSVYAFLRMEPKDGYFEHKKFIDVVEEWYLDQADMEVRTATGLIEEASYAELFSRYVNHVTHFVRKEKIRNPITGDYEAPDGNLMSEVEKVLGVKGDPKEFRQGLMTKIGAWSVDHGGKRVDYLEIFPSHFERLSNNYFEQQRQRVRRILQDSILILSEETAGLPKENVKHAQNMLDRLVREYHYCSFCAREAISLLLRKRYLQ